jgi:hypothetical protein
VLLGSISGKGNCRDIAVMERFFMGLKLERVWHRDYANHAEVTNDMADDFVGFSSIRLPLTIMAPKKSATLSRVWLSLTVCCEDDCFAVIRPVYWYVPAAKKRQKKHQALSKA